MALPNAPKVVYNATTLLLSLPARPWVPITTGVGAGREESAAGVPAAWVTRRDYALRVPLRFLESEWPAVRAWLVWAMDTAGSFDFYPDQAGSTFFVCYLTAPAPDAELQPARGEYPGTFELEVVIRRTTAAAMEPSYY